MTEQEVDRYAGELQRHGVESVEREVRWLSDLINAERSDPHAHQQPTTPTAEAPSQDTDRDASDRQRQLAHREGRTTPWVRFE